MPRPYRLGERAALVEATRVKIVDAAIELSMEVGVSAATMRQISKRADVAPGTLRYHFPSREDLDRAMVERLTAEAPLPDRTLFSGARSIEDRLDRLIRATGTFFDRADRIYRMWLRERMLTPVWTETGAAYGARWDQLMREALGTLQDDSDALTALRAVLDMSFFQAVRAGAGSYDAACALIAALVTPWFVARAAGRDAGEFTLTPGG